MFTISELFDLAVQMEENGERFYRGACDRTPQEGLKKLFGWLADQEALHKVALAQLKDKSSHGDEPGPSSATGRRILRRAMGRRAFSLDEIRVDSIRDEAQILRAALAFEEDTILFFEFISPFISDPRTSSVLEKIKTEESNHKLLISEKLSEIRAKCL